MGFLDYASNWRSRPAETTLIRMVGRTERRLAASRIIASEQVGGAAGNEVRSDD
jgi:hypothetical protein